jgi:hypothetical protein
MVFLPFFNGNGGREGSRNTPEEFAGSEGPGTTLKQQHPYRLLKK